MTQPRKYELLIFDLDGVVTTEFIYWECARLTLWELIYRAEPGEPVAEDEAPHSADARETLLPLKTIYMIKNRAINSNWDLTFLASCALLLQLPVDGDQPIRTVQALEKALNRSTLDYGTIAPLVEALLVEHAGLNGAALLDAINQRVRLHLGCAAPLLAPGGAWWQCLYDRFQLWYDGTLLEAIGAPKLEEKMTMPIYVLWETFEDFKAKGYTIGIATGRPFDEAMGALKRYGLWQYFDAKHIATYDDVAKAEKETGKVGLGKPHPLAIRRALFPEKSYLELLEFTMDRDLPSALVIGDTTSDVVAAKAAGLPCVGVLSGVHGADAEAQRKQALIDAGAVDVIRSMALLPYWLTHTDRE